MNASDTTARLIRAARQSMRAYAMLWRALRGSDDCHDLVRADDALRHAQQCRDMSLRWQLTSQYSHLL